MTFDTAHETSELAVDRRSRNRRVTRERQVAISKVLKNAEAEIEVATPLPERRQKVERRRQVDPTTCERDYSEPQIEFMSAMDGYKRKSGRQFPTWSEVLEVLNSLGYRKVAEATEIDIQT